jgi:hypothetical protein
VSFSVGDDELVSPSLLMRASLFLCSTLLAGGLASSGQCGDNDGGEIWGGLHVSMQMTAQGATLEFDCAHGAILAAVKPDAAGDFRVTGTYTPEHGGPIRKDNPPRDLPATYKGTIHGDTMQLQVELSDKDQQPPALTLTRGTNGRVMKCR